MSITGLVIEIHHDQVAKCQSALSMGILSYILVNANLLKEELDEC